MNNDQKKAIGERLRSARKLMRLKQCDVAGEMRVVQQSVSSWEAGRTMPSIEALMQLCEIYGTGPQSILVGGPAEQWVPGAKARPMSANEKAA